MSPLGLLLPLLTALNTSGPASLRPAPAPQAPAAAAAPAPRRSLAAGEAAPDFAFVGDYGWKHLHDLRAEGAVLILFEPDDVALAGIEHECAALGARAIEPVAVRTRGDGENWDTIARLGLDYALFSDPAGSLATQFGLCDPRTGRPRSAWCLVGRDGRVRRVVEGMPPAAEIAAAAVSAAGEGPSVASGDASR